MICVLTLLTTAQIFQFEDKVFVLPPYKGIEKLVGMALFCVLLFGNILQHFMQSVATTTSCVEIHRKLDFHINNLKPDEDKGTLDNLPLDWPVDGSISFMNVKMKYWPHSAPALKGMTFTIHPEEKIGMVGLPGSGKKSIVAALYRLVELSQGSVWIGGTNISEVPLDKLRSSIALVPQNPVFFTGTIRLNMDPECMYSTNELFDSLLKINMYESVNNLPNQLNTRVEYIGDRLSVFEKQLIYVARAILQEPKILILEEPITDGTEDKQYNIFEVVNKIFQSCTILVVAHQLKYVLDCNRVIIIKDGQVAEFDTPERLFKDPKSCFTQMLSESTDVFETAL